MKFLLLMLLICIANATKEFQFKNNLPTPIWVGCLGNKKMINGALYTFPALNNGGWILNPGQSNTVQAQDNWEGRFWGRTGCSSATNYCDTGDCGHKLQCNGNGGVPPTTLVEIFLSTDPKLTDIYDISLVDGFNVPVSIQPVNGQGSCKYLACRSNQIIPQCPDQLKVKNKAGAVVACNSACNVLREDKYCCRNAFKTPQTCPATNYSKFFKDRCPDAYSYAYDDKTSTFSCKAKTYKITFGY